MRYRCLVLDHDDTVMDSSRAIHYPAFLAAMEVLRPGRTWSIEEFFRLNYDPGFLPYCQDVLQLNEMEQQEEYEIWQSFVRRSVPPAFPGIKEVLSEFRGQGGKICVVSHSVSEMIRRDYRENALPEPDMVFGWERPPKERKPEPFPLFEIQRQLGIAPGEMLVVDDLRLGQIMAERAGADFAAALWSNEIPSIREDMERISPVRLYKPEELRRVLFSAAKQGN